MSEEFEKYESMRLAGMSAVDVYRAAVEAGSDQLVRIKMLRQVFGMSLLDAKRLSFTCDTGENPDAQSGVHEDEYVKILDDELGL